MSDDDLQQRYRGALLGVAIGDALGAPLEGTYCVSPTQVERELASNSFARFTDDTHMTIALAESLIERNGFDGAHLATTFANHYFAEPWRGYGSGPPRIFRAIADGADWQEPARRLFDGAGSYGNGAAMRVAPVALFASHDLDRVVRLARQTASITHTHEFGLAGAALQAVSISLLLRLPQGKTFDIDGFLDLLKKHLNTPEFQQRLRHVHTLLPDAEPEHVVAALGNGIAAIDSVPTALFAFLRTPSSFDEVIRFAMKLGGDVDTIASMAGALSGAYLGEQAVPADWVQRVEAVTRIRDLADELYLLSNT